MRKSLLWKHLLASIFMLFFCTLSFAQYHDGSTNYSALQDAINAASLGDIITIDPGAYAIPSTVNVNKSVTINGGSTSTTKLQTSGTGYLFLVTAPNVSIKNLEIEKTDDNVSQNIIGIQANNFELANTSIHGLFVIGDAEITRGVEASPGYANVNIHDNIFKSLRQPGYINPGVTGVINNNLTSITKGWVVESNSNVSFSGNTWGSGLDVNYEDIAIIQDPSNNYPDIVTMSNNNNNAIIENKFYSPAILSIVHVQTGFVGGDGTITKPYGTIIPSVPRVAAGGRIVVAAGTYNENIIVDKPASLRGANYGISCSTGRGAESVVNGTQADGSSTFTVQSSNVTIDGFTITNHAGSFGISESAKSNLDFEHNIITDIGNNTTGTYAFGNDNSFGVYIEVGGSNSSSGVTISNNCINNIRGGQNTSLSGPAGKSNNGSAGGILVGSSNVTQSISGLIISGNKIDHITAATVAFTNGGKGAYGMNLSVGGSGSGSIQNAVITNNEINTLEGLWAHGVGLEGRTPNALVTNNTIQNLIDHKGNTDAIGVLVQDNDASTTVSINLNSLTNSAYAIVNLKPGTVNGTCNWYGTTDASIIATKIGGPVTYIPYLTNGTDTDPAATGFQPVPNSCNGPQPTISFTVSSSNGSQSTSNGSPSNLTVSICSSGTFTFSKYSSNPSASVGTIEKLSSSGNVVYNSTYNVPSDRPQTDISPSQAMGYFSGTYGPYTLSSGTSGTIDQTYTPYYDANGNNQYDAGIDILGSPVTLHYDINAKPTIICPGNQTVNTDPRNCSAVVTYAVTSTGTPTPTMSYVFSGATTGSGAGTGSGSTFYKGTTTVTETATNLCSSISCIFTITVTDNEKPAITCPHDADITCNSSIDPSNTGSPTFNDNCPGTTAAYTDASDQDPDPTADGHYNYTITRTWTATDAAGNKAKCDQVITVTTDTYTWYEDFDHDGYGNPGSIKYSCTQPSGYVSNNYDCNDRDAGKKPGDADVIMCHDGKQECVKASDIDKKLGDKNGKWSLGPCDPPCKGDNVIMCHMGKLHCVKSKDVAKHQAKGWTLGYCNSMPVSSARISSSNEVALNSQSDKPLIPTVYNLSNYPNPFSMSTIIKYDVPVDSRVTLKVFNISGQEITTLVDGDKKAGSYTVQFNASLLSTGIYYCKYIGTSETQQFVKSQQLSVIK